jgi:hypothetical protein
VIQKSLNVLIVSPFFFPEPISTGKFNTDLALALRDSGCKVTVICSHPIYPKWKVEESNQKINDVSIIRGGKRIHYSKNPTIRRITLELWFSFFVIKQIFKHQKNADLIIPVFPPSLAFYFVLPFLKKKIKKIGMVHDLQEVYSKDKKGVLNKSISLLINKVESKALRNCDKLIFLSNEMKNTAKDFYQLSEKRLFVQYPFSNINLETRTNDLDALLPKNKTHIVYSGALGEKQNPSGLYKFYNFASKYLENTCFHFFSQGQFFENLKLKNTNQKIRFHNLVPLENLEELYRKSTVQIIPQLPNTSKGSLPSKLPNLMASKCKILFITDSDSEIDILFKKYGLSKVVTSWDNDAILSSLNDLLKEKNNTNTQTKVAKELFSIESMTNKILK